jgi:hypothetical protein
MNNQQIRAITRNPKAMMDFQILGKLPPLEDSLSTPLRELILTIPVGHWDKYKGITVDKHLGFNGQLTFHSTFQLMRWLGYQQKIVGNQSLPYYSFVNRRFKSKLTIEQFSECCKVSPK